MAHVDHIDEARPQQIVLFRGAVAVLHGGSPKLQGLCRKFYENLRRKANEITPFSRQISNLNIVQG
ncbi:hypothetical protein [Tropicibacter alexandrii]|uniref:hypothetical protein n=1 Tax=Tropicibacter alexandrii TaxID=2267683 RepID=UPI00197D4D11|nr:hypothetical protein [Tropicibacter alexandrii]